MLDAMGIMQHHDAITGTAKQAVADSYAAMLSSAVTSNNELYSKFIGEKAAMAGLTDAGLEWNACQQTSTTPVDCSYTGKTVGDTYLVGAHNPSTLKQELLRFEVNATMTYKVEKIGADNAWVEVPADKLCYTATKDNKQGDSFDACELFISAEIAPQGTQFFRVEVVAEDTVGREALLVEDTVIANEEGLSLKYVGQDSKDRALFSFTESANGTPQNVAFSL